MSASFDWSGGGDLASLGTPTMVCRYDAGEFTRLPNIAWDTIQHRIGARVPVATFRYLMDDAATALGWPNQFDQVWPITSNGPLVVQPDDRIVVLGWTPDGEARLLFDGFAQIPQADVRGSSQVVSFQALGVACRLWDDPIAGRVQRPADRPALPGLAVETDLPTRFNPTDHRGVLKPNCTPDLPERNDRPEKAYPVFLDPGIVRDPDPRKSWTLSGAIRYLMGYLNDEEYVENPDFGDLDDLLKARAPRDGSETYDPGDDGTYRAREIVLRDYDATNKPWPEAVAELLGYHGFGMAFRSELRDGAPRNWIDCFRLDPGAAAAPKPVWLDRPGRPLDPGRNTAESISLARDLSQVVNGFTVETAPRRVEIAVVLAPGFTPQAGDESSTARAQFYRSKLDNATDLVRKKYRWYVADEAGDGHWDPAVGAWVGVSPLDLSPVWPDRDDGTRSYCARLRPGLRRLCSLDPAKQPREATLAYSQDYAGAVASVWDGTGTWTNIAGGWRLLNDRLGIEVTIEDPEQWAVGKNQRDLRGITWQANPPAGKRFYLRLVVAIEDDVMLGATLGRRAASPTRFTRYRRVDARDHFQLLQVHKSSPFYSGNGKDLQATRDDTDRALAHAAALRARHEFPPVAGKIGFPFLTNAYRLGDFVDRIAGRGVSLRVNTGAGQGEARQYPAVVGVSLHQGDRGQRTEIQLQDFRADPQGVA